MRNDIDAVDYAILKSLDENGASWKKRVHTWVEENIDRLPTMEAHSLQTFGRRLDQLNEDGLVESCIISPDEVERQMIIGYKLTMDGKTALGIKRNAVLRDKIVRSAEALLTQTERDVPIDREALIELLVDEFDMSVKARELMEECETQELIALLAIHYFRNSVDTTIRPDSAARLSALIRETDAFSDSFTSETVVEKIREHLVAAGSTVEGHVWKRVPA